MYIAFDRRKNSICNKSKLHQITPNIRSPVVILQVKIFYEAIVCKKPGAAQNKH